jgi:hypothetical protein
MLSGKIQAKLLQHAARTADGVALVRTCSLLLLDVQSLKYSSGLTTSSGGHSGARGSLVAAAQICSASTAACSETEQLRKIACDVSILLAVLAPSVNAGVSGLRTSVGHAFSSRRAEHSCRACRAAPAPTASVLCLLDAALPAQSSSQNIHLRRTPFMVHVAQVAQTWQERHPALWLCWSPFRLSSVASRRCVAFSPVSATVQLLRRWK